MIINLVSAFAAALLYGAGTVLQAVGIRRGAAAAKTTTWARLWAARLYAVGLAFDGLGFIASIAALRGLPLFVVESVIASSVAVTALLAVIFLGVRLTRKEVIALVAVSVGLVTLAATASGGSGIAFTGRLAWLVLGLVVPVAALGAIASRLRSPIGAPLLAIAAGLGFGGVGVAARVLTVPHHLWRVVLDPVSWALVVYAIIALVAFGLALQRGSVTSVAAVAFTVETVVPAVIGLVWLGDRVRPGAQGAAALGFALTLAGCIVLARYTTETVAEEPERRRRH